MPGNSVEFRTPHYLLMNNHQPFGPALGVPVATAPLTAVYGFSGKPAYDMFLHNCEQPLQPYPLVNGYLQNQHTGSPESVRLVVLDAAGAGDSILHAARFSDVLAARNSNAVHMASSDQLLFDQSAGVYQQDTTP